MRLATGTRWQLPAHWRTCFGRTPERTPVVRSRRESLMLTIESSITSGAFDQQRTGQTKLFYVRFGSFDSRGDRNGTQLLKMRPLHEHSSHAATSNRAYKPSLFKQRALLSQVAR